MFTLKRAEFHNDKLNDRNQKLPERQGHVQQLPWISCYSGLTVAEKADIFSGLAHGPFESRASDTTVFFYYK